MRVLLVPYLVVLAIASGPSCVPGARLDPCEGCPGSCSEQLCELATVEGSVGAMAAWRGSAYVCATAGAESHLFIVSASGDRTAIGTVPGPCARVVVAEPFVYFGAQGIDGGIHRADLTGDGLHLEQRQPYLTDFAVVDGSLVATTTEHSTPTMTVAGARFSMAPLEQEMVAAGPIAPLPDGRLVWGIPTTREVLVSSADGQIGGSVFNGAGKPPLGAAFFVAADADGAVLIDGERLFALPVDAPRAPLPLGEALVDPKAIVLSQGEIIVAEGNRIRAFRRDAASAPVTLSEQQVTALATDGSRVFVGRGSSVLELRRPPVE